MLRKRKAASRGVPAWKLAMDANYDESAPLPPLPLLPPLTSERDLRTVDDRQDHSRSKSGSRSRSRSPQADISHQQGATAAEDPPESEASKFEPSLRFLGPRRGRVFRAGIHGIGYYIDIGTEAGSVAAEFERMRAAISASSSDVSSTIDDVDAPIIASHASHMRALKEAEDQSEMLAKELAAWGRASSSLRHAAEQLEVRLTEQLRQLIDMQDDCCTVEARLACKSVIDRLHSVGKKLLCVSQAGTKRSERRST